MWLVMLCLPRSNGRYGNGAYLYLYFTARDVYLGRYCLNIMTFLQWFDSSLPTGYLQCIFDVKSTYGGTSVSSILWGIN